MVQVIILLSYCCYNKLPQIQRLKQHRFIILQFCELKNLYGSRWDKNQGIGWAVFLLGAVRANPFTCILQLLEVAPLVGSFSPFFIFKASNVTSLFLAIPQSHLSLTGSSFLHSSSTFKDPCDSLGPPGYSRIILFQGHLMSNLNSICKLNSPLPYSLTYSQVPGTGCECLGGMTFFYCTHLCIYLTVRQTTIMWQATSQALRIDQRTHMSPTFWNLLGGDMTLIKLSSIQVLSCNSNKEGGIL